MASTESKSPPAALTRLFDQPDETREFPLGRFDVVTVGGVTLGRATYQPGWRWSRHVGPTVGASTCLVEHVGLVLSGRAVVAMDDGRTLTIGPGMMFHVGPGHDSWVEGDEPYVSIHMLGAGEYTRPRGQP